MPRYKVCYECGSTEDIKYFGGKELCEKCLFWYDSDGGEEYDDDEEEEYED